MPEEDQTFDVLSLFEYWKEDIERMENYDKFKMKLPTKDQLLKTIELMFLKEDELATNISYYMKWATHKVKMNDYKAK